MEFECIKIASKQMQAKGLKTLNKQYNETASFYDCTKKVLDHENYKKKQAILVEENKEESIVTIQSVKERFDKGEDMRQHRYFCIETKKELRPILKTEIKENFFFYKKNQFDYKEQVQNTYPKFYGRQVEKLYEKEDFKELNKNLIQIGEEKIFMERCDSEQPEVGKIILKLTTFYVF